MQSAHKVCVGNRAWARARSNRARAEEEAGGGEGAGKGSGGGQGEHGQQEVEGGAEGQFVCASCASVLR